MSTVPEMKFGVAIFPTTDVPSPAKLARMAQDCGFESLFFPEHTHIPASRDTPYPAGGELPPEYSRTYDPFIALATAAQATDRILLGTAVCLVIERDPIITAKEVASLDCLSNGRFLFVVGAGWNREEMANHGTDPSTRFGLMRERVEAMKAIWTQDEASYRGRHVEFERIWCWPKPVQQPHPPVLVGGNGPRVLDRVLAYGDEWVPNRMKDVEMIARIRELHERCSEQGRAPIPVTVSGLMHDARRIESLEQAGAHRGYFWLPSTVPDEVERALERSTAVMREYQSAG